MDLRKHLQNRNHWLLTVFAIYILSIFAFSLVYYFIYKSTPKNFAFASDILKRQSEIVKSATEHDVERLVLKIDILKQLQTQLNCGTECINLTKEDDVITVKTGTSDHKYVFERLSPVIFAGGPEYLLNLTILDDQGNRIVSDTKDYIFKPNLEIGTLKSFTSTRINENESLLLADRQRLETLTGDAPDVWSYEDFFYFSTITQTTVGYGDILPNSTLVRKVVVLQIMVGLLIIGVVINFAFSKKRKPAKSSANDLAKVVQQASVPASIPEPGVQVLDQDTEQKGKKVRSTSHQLGYSIAPTLMGLLSLLIAFDYPVEGEVNDQFIIIGFFFLTIALVVPFFAYSRYGKKFVKWTNHICDQLFIAILTKTQSLFRV